MKNVKIFESLGAGWALFIKRPWYLLGLMLAGLAMFVVLGSNTVVAPLSAIVYAGLLAVMLRYYRGEAFVFDDLFTIDQRWIYFAFLTLIKTFLIMLGFLAFIIPGVYLSVRWMFAEMLVVDKGLRPLEALKASSALTAGVRWKLFFFAITATLLVFIGLIFLIVGALVATVVTFLAMIHIYHQLQNSVTTVVSENQN